MSTTQLYRVSPVCTIRPNKILTFREEDFNTGFYRGYTIAGGIRAKRPSKGRTPLYDVKISFQVWISLPLVEIDFLHLPKFVVQFLNLEELFLSTSLRLQVQVQPKLLLPVAIESDLTMKILLLRQTFLRVLKIIDEFQEKDEKGWLWSILKSLIDLTWWRSWSTT